MRVLLIALLALAGIAPASAADLKILTAGAFKSAAQELAAEFEKKTGHKVTVENDTAGAGARRGGGGEYVGGGVVAPAPKAAPPGGQPVESSAQPRAPRGRRGGPQQGRA